jgi:hypothetical protein
VAAAVVVSSPSPRGAAANAIPSFIDPLQVAAGSARNDPKNDSSSTLLLLIVAVLALPIALVMAVTATVLTRR